MICLENYLRGSMGGQGSREQCGSWMGVRKKKMLEKMKGEHRWRPAHCVFFPRAQPGRPGHGWVTKHCFQLWGIPRSKGLCDTGFNPIFLTQVMPVARIRSPLLASRPLTILQPSQLAPLGPLERVRQLLQLFL